MSAPSIIQRLQRRRCYPVKIDGEDYHVRAMTIRELEILGALPGECAAGWAIGCALVNSDRSAIFTLGTVTDPTNPAEARPETNEEFARRVQDNLVDIPNDSMHELTAAIGKLNRVPDQETLQKN